jgi:hypothetical protein
MKYFLDTEFLEDGVTIDLLSIGIVCEDGREFYAVNADFNFDRIYSACTERELRIVEWVRENVMPYIDRAIAIPRKEIRKTLEEFIIFPHSPPESETPQAWLDEYHKPEFYGYYSDYDWVAFCQIFGRMIDLPNEFPKFCRDIKQMAVELGNPQLPKQDGSEHHALADARWNKVAYDFLVEHKAKHANDGRRDLALECFGVKP